MTRWVKRYIGGFKGTRYEREALGLMMVTHETHRRRMPIAFFAKIALVATRAGRTVKSTR